MFDHYSELLKVGEGKAPGFFTCPHGLESYGPVKWTANDRVISGFLSDPEKAKTLPSEVAKGAATTKPKIEAYLAVISNIVREQREQSYSYLEAAIHDIRHLNSDISSHAGQILAIQGYNLAGEWKINELNKNELCRRALSSYCASRDISAALSLYEIAIDPSRAIDEIIKHQIHGSFYRQRQICSDRLTKKRLELILGNTDKALNLTKSFGLIPIILLNNAIKYAEPNSPINIQFIEAGNFFRIICTNLGPIVRKDELPKMFDQGIRGSNKSGIAGHGIGLWLARLIVEANYGVIEMETEEQGRDVVGRRIGVTRLIVRLLNQVTVK